MFSFFKKKIIVPHIRLAGVIGSAGRFRQGIDFSGQQEIIKKAFIAAEDRRFYKHNGVDFWSIGRATISNIKQRSIVEGGSTITQQLARMVFLSQDQTLTRKIKEAALSFKIERGTRK